MKSFIRGGWWRWKFRNILYSIAVLLMCLQKTAVLSCQVDCNKVLTASSGFFTSPCYPSEYPKSQACKWTLQAPAGFIVQITFCDFELEEALGCIYDRVIVSNGKSEVTFCGITANGLSFNSTGNVMNVSFNSDFSVQKKGFNITYRQVAVSLRNQKVSLKQNKAYIESAPQVTIPVLRQFTTCFEAAKSGRVNKDWMVYSYMDSSSNDILTFVISGTYTALTVLNQTCMLTNILSESDFSLQMTLFCLTWDSTTGNTAVYTGGNYKTSLCGNTKGKIPQSNGMFVLGSKNGNMDAFSGDIYNFRLWDSAKSKQQLSSLTCDVKGSILDWENEFWVIPASYIKTDSTLSCICYPSCSHLTTATPSRGTSIVSPSAAPTASCTSSGLGCPEGIFYRISFVVYEYQVHVTELEVEQAVLTWLNHTFQNWTYSVYVANISIQVSSSISSRSARSTVKRYICQALLIYKYTSVILLQEEAIQRRLVQNNITMGSGLVLETVAVQSVENCYAEENPFHYKWPESRPIVTQFSPCFPNKAQNASRTCMLNLQNYTSYWSPPDLGNCTGDIDSIAVSAENAADVATQLVDITNFELTKEEVTKIVTKLKEIINVAKINASLASTVVTVFSNVMTSSDSALAASSPLALKTVDELALKILFDGPSLSITSKNLALGISAVNHSMFNGTLFSATAANNASDIQVDFETDQQNPLAEIRLPSTLLSNLSDVEIDIVSRIHFTFFSKTGLFQEQKTNGNSLNSFVVASSVGNVSINNLQDPVRIQIQHIHYQPEPKPVCVFWDFTLKNGSGGWSGDGCAVSPESNSNMTICLCNHLTHFGVLMDISGAAHQIDQQNTKILTFITYIGCGISAIFSAATLLTYIAFEKLRRDYPSKILMNLSTSLLFLNMVFLVDGWLTSFEVKGLCIAVAVFLHYFLLTSFTWMGLESIHMYIALVKVFNTYIRRYILKFCIVGWGLPAVIVGIVIAIDRNSYGKQHYGKDENGQSSSEFCWVNNQVVFYVTCAGYFGIVFLMNVAMFIVVMMQICGRNGKRSNRTLREEVLRNLRSVVSLTFLLGMTWGFAFFAWGPVNLAFMYLFSIFNSLQGLFIFIFHCALKENVQKQWRRYLCCGRFRLADNSDWSKTATNNTKKVSSDNLGKSLSSSSIGSTTANWTSKAKSTLNPFAKRGSNTGKMYSDQTNTKLNPVEGDPTSIIPVHQVIDKVKGYCSVRSDNFYKNIIMSDSFSHSTKF
ncbi:adhesion G-protein coupled receptor G6 isoform X6 [Lepisosteus oculatus]|uniref:adhesion G-protein coupled receptor G6 isoform X6 n=1 Tax=Lepisosteus oculatus TaxID=7918 RepID=UPI0035F523AD